MTRPEHPVLDVRDLTALLAAVRERLPAYTPDWQPGETGPGAVVLQALAHNLRVLAERVNQAPTKNQMAFLDLLGLDTISAQGARAPVVFQARRQIPDGRVPAGTQVGAKPPGGGDPITFETEQAIALAAGRLTDVVTVWPGRDAYADHGPRTRQTEPVTLFESLLPVPHELYLAHDVHLALAGHVTVEIQFDLATAGSQELPLVWEYWDGEDWRPFAEPVEADDPEESFDGTAGLTRSGVVRLVSHCAEAKPTTLQGITSYWIRARLAGPLPPTGSLHLPMVDRIRIRTAVSRTGLAPDSAYADQLKLDLTNAFQPLGPAPAAGATWYLSSKEAFSKPGATVTLSASHVVTIAATAATETPQLVLEQWDGAAWQLTISDDDSENDPVRGLVNAGGSLTFTVAGNPMPTTVAGTESYWLRIRITSGGFAAVVAVPDAGISSVVYVPPVLAEVRIAYEYTVGGREHPAACLTYNDFRWEDRSEQVHGTGRPFEVFTPVADRTPTLYLGFDAALPADLIGLYLDLEPVPAGTRNPTLRWEHWDGTGWRSVTVRDETEHLALPGMVDVLWPGTPPVPAAGVLQASGTAVVLMGPAEVRPFRAGDKVYVENEGDGELATVASATALELTLRAPLGQQYTQARISIAALPRFGVPRVWLRARMDSDGQPAMVRLRGIHVNAVWAVQARTVSDELVGASSGQARQVFFFRERPVLRGEVVEVRELTGPRAAVELPLLLADLRRNGMSEEDVRLGRDRRTGKVSEVWVRWRARPNLFFSGPEDRHYVVERTRGRLLFGDGRRGRIPPPGPDNVLARRYRSGGGQAGNLPAGAISELISGVLAQGVTNPRAAEGGADAQPTDDVLRTGPEATRHRRQAVSLADYEALAREASPAVAVARALPATHPSGRPAPGWVTVVVVPHSQEPRPELSFELRRQIQRFLAERVPAPVAGRIAVTGPAYLPIGVNAVLAPVDPSEAGPVRAAVVAALERFLHPLLGGPQGRGWAFGRDVYLSDLAATVEGLAGVDYLSSLELLVAGSPQQEVVPVPPDRIVVAGTLRVSLAGREG